MAKRSSSLQGHCVFPADRLGQSGNQQADNRCKQQGMGEVPVEVEAEQGVGIGADQHIEVGCGAGDCADHEGAAHRAPARGDGRSGGAEAGLSEWIHVV